MKRTIDQKQHFGHLRLNDPFAVHQLETQLCIVSTVSDNESTSHDGNHYLGLYLPCLPRKFRVTFYKKAVQNEVLRKILCIVRMMLCGLLRNALSNKKLWHQTIHRLFSQHITPMGIELLVISKHIFTLSVAPELLPPSPGPLLVPRQIQDAMTAKHIPWFRQTWQACLWTPCFTATDAIHAWEKIMSDSSPVCGA